MKRDIPTRVTEMHAQLADRLLELDDLPSVPVAMATVSLLLWTVLYREWLPMLTIDGPTAMRDPGVLEAMGTNNGFGGVVLYFVTWGLILSAVLYPAMIPFVSRYVSGMSGPAVEKARAIGAFLGTFSLLWAATSVFPLTVDALVDIAAIVDRYGALLVGSTAIVAGLYQLTSAKRTALTTSHSTVTTHEPSVREGIQRGVEHALSSARCTWALVALMVVVGSTNPFWMLLLTAVVTLERFSPRRDEIAATVGATAILSGSVLTVVSVLGA